MLQRYQLVQYNLTPVHAIENFLTSLPLLEDKELYDLSLECEPRGGKAAPQSKAAPASSSNGTFEPSIFNNIGPGFWNVRGNHDYALGLVDIGTV